MIELFRDPFWQFIGVIIGLLAIGVPIVIYLLQRTKKSLQYEILSNNSLLTIKEELEGKLQILYENQSVTNLQLIVIKFINTGNLPIASKDFESPLRLDFTDKGEVLSGEITDKYPDNLKVSLILDEDYIELTPTLLNSKDSITIKALVSNYSKKPEINARIIGINSIHPISEMSLTSFSLIFSGLLILSLSIFMLIRTLEAKNLWDSTEQTIYVFIVIGYLIMGLGLLINKKLRSRFYKVFSPFNLDKNKED